MESVVYGVVYALVYYGIPLVGVCTRNVSQQNTAYGWDARLLKTCGGVITITSFLMALKCGALCFSAFE